MSVERDERAHGSGPRPHAHEDGDLLPLEAYRDLILSRVEPLPPAELPLRDAFGRVLAGDVRAAADIPAFASSAMDGFAVRAGDAASASLASPVRLRVAGAVEMGRPPAVPVGAGEAVRIPTGGAIPEGADAVVPIEDCHVDGGHVLVLSAPGAGAFVRPAGQDVRSGEVLVPAGRRLLGPDLGLLATAGLASASVHPRARVAVLSTGDELVEPGGPLGPGQLHDANAFTLWGAVLEAGGEPVSLGAVPDEPPAVREALLRAGPVHAYVTSGGVSVGERDPVKGAFRGGEVEFHRVAIQPGMPQAFGRLDSRPFFGLPGNPVSAFVSFELFVRPALLRMMGRRDLFRPEVIARLEGEIPGLPTKARLARVRVHPDDGGWTAVPTGGPGSNLLSTVGRANGLAVVPPGTAALGAGDRCRVMLFREPGEE